MAAKHSYLYVKNYFESNGCVLLSSEYKNSNQKLDYICSNLHKHSMVFRHFKEGHRCPRCLASENSRRFRFSYDSIKYSFEGSGYQLLTNYYVNAHQHLEYRCPKGHINKMTYNNWSKGYRCPICAAERSSDNKRLSYYFVEAAFEKEGYTLLTTKYKNNRQKLKFICSKGHISSLTYTAWKRGNRCPKCAIINKSGSNHYNWKGGISCEPYCAAWADKEYKNSIKERDNYQCQNPDCWGKDKRLTVHHIDYNKKNCRPGNLITLCGSCNSRANYNRDRHKELYQDTMNKKYNYKELYK